MRLCSFKHASTNKIISGDWAPFSPSYYPFADVNEFCNPCYRWRFLSLLRGCFPRWEFLLKDPRNPSADFPQFFNVSKTYRNFSIVLMRALSRSSHPDSIIRNIPHPALLLDYISGGVDPEVYHGFAMDLIGIWLERLHSDGVLCRYLSTDQTLFNLFILNENFDLYRFNQTHIDLVQRAQSGVGIIQPRQPQTFSWRGGISIYGTIPIINLENQEIRVPVPIADNFFEPNLDLSDDINTPEGIRDFFILNEFHKMWILRESIAQIIDDQKFQVDLNDGLDNLIFTSGFDLSSFNFRDFEIVVDTIDHSITLDQVDFRNETGQAAIIYDLLYQPYPNIVNSFQDRNPCPFRIGQDPNNPYSCPLSGNMGCGMSDRRITNLQFPRDRIERNIYKFLRLLRDETIFSHEALYKITRLHHERLDELNQYSDFWIGSLHQDNSQRWIFEPNMPSHWNLPRPSDKIFEVCLISPLCYESGLKIRFASQTGTNNFVVNPITVWNPWVEEAPFNSGAHIDCIIGQLSVDNFNFNINRQKKQLVKTIQYSSRSMSQVPLTDRPNAILERRLIDRDRRAGMATFGRFSRFV